MQSLVVFLMPHLVSTKTFEVEEEIWGRAKEAVVKAISVYVPTSIRHLTSVYILLNSFWQRTALGKSRFVSNEGLQRGIVRQIFRVLALLNH